jgi:hypothetical protein
MVPCGIATRPFAQGGRSSPLLLRASKTKRM